MQEIFERLERELFARYEAGEITKAELDEQQRDLILDYEQERDLATLERT